MIDENPIRRFQNLFHAWVEIRYSRRIFFAFDIFGDERHGAGPVQGDHRVEVGHHRGFQLFEVRGHAAPGHLENAECFAAGEHVVHFFVILRNAIEIHVDSETRLYALHRIGEHGEVGQPQKVEFEQTDSPILIRDRVHIVLRDSFAALGIELDGRIFGDALRRDHYAGGMHADVPGVAFDLAREVENLPRLRIVVIEFFEFGHVLQGAVDRNREALLAEGNYLGYLVAERVGVAEGAGNVAHGCARHHGAECSDLHHVVSAVFLPRIFDELVAAIVGNVHIDVRRARALGIEEALERQVEFHRVDRCDATDVGDHRACGGATRVGVNPLSPRVMQKVGDDEKVRRISFLLDDFELVVDALSELGAV